MRRMEGRRAGCTFAEPPVVQLMPQQGETLPAPQGCRAQLHIMQSVVPCAPRNCLLAPVSSRRSSWLLTETCL